MKTAKEVLVEAGLDQSHWGIRVIAAESNGLFTEYDTHDSGDWFSCACGKLDDHIKRNQHGEPEDQELNEYGMKFYIAVACRDFLEAALSLIKIENRSMELLRGEA
tara:strand:+ start:244 stop:561 length:318 start_codon:yes stop_codon:yes gene_type:complete